MISESRIDVDRALSAGGPPQKLALNYEFRAWANVRAPTPTFKVQRVLPDGIAKGKEAINKLMALHVELDVVKRDGKEPLNASKITKRRTAVDSTESSDPKKNHLVLVNAGDPDDTDGSHYFAWKLAITTVAGFGMLDIVVGQTITSGPGIGFHSIRTDRFIVSAKIDEVNTGSGTKQVLRLGDAPRVVDGINLTPVIEAKELFADVLDPSDPAKQPEVVKRVIAHVWRRLLIGLDAVWQHQDTRLGFRGIDQSVASDPMFGGDDTKRRMFLAEEKWARAYSEKIASLPYGGPRITMMGPSQDDSPFFRKLQDDFDPAYPLVAACQHLCSMAIVSRGFNLPPDPKHADVLLMCDASKATGGIITKLGGTFSEVHTIATPESDMTQHHLAPGSMYMFDNHETASDKTSRHIAFVLRVDKDHSWIQFFDTGAMMSPGSDAPLPGSSNIFDYPLWDAKKPPSGPKPQSVPTPKYEGLGVLPTPGNGVGKAPDLAKGTQRIIKARPIGLARLVIVRRSDKKLLYATPYLRMHTDETDPAGPMLSFSFMRYLWSLREVPNKDTLDVAWQIDLPKHELCNVMLSVARVTTVLGYAMLVSRGFDLLKAEGDGSLFKRVFDDAGKALPKPGESLLDDHVDLQSTTAGGVQMAIRNPHVKAAEGQAHTPTARDARIAKLLHWRKPTSELLNEGQLQALQGQIPQYFRGEFGVMVALEDRMLNITLLDSDDHVRLNVGYMITYVGGEPIQGTTDNQGRILQVIPESRPAQATLVVEPGRPAEQTYILQLGPLPSADTIAGVQARLNNLGYNCGPPDGKLSEKTKNAITEFQHKHTLKETGDVNAETRDKLKELYGV